MKKIFISIFIFLLLILPVVAKCAYCGQSAYGRNCVYAPNGLHEHRDNPSKCKYCGQSVYGRNCVYSPAKHLHIHASGGDKCIYCGSTSLGRNCVYSPNGVHER